MRDAITNVVSLASAHRGRGKAMGQRALAPLLTSFAQHRRQEGDVFWLKENAELLSILAASGRGVPEAALAVYQPFYDRIDTRLVFFPQYYRFFMSIALSLEALGFRGGKSALMAQWLVREGWADAEISDMQRAEARYLIEMAGAEPEHVDAGLDGRLHRFLSRATTFAVPNRRAAYELTHIVFYLSRYGQIDPKLPQAAARSLANAGTLAFLEQNLDLLAEVCVALHYARLPIPEGWLAWLRQDAAAIKVVAGAQGEDDYHTYFVCHWLFATLGLPSFDQIYYAGAMMFQPTPVVQSPLRGMSQALLALEGARSDDWAAMRKVCVAGLSDGAHEVLCAAEAAVDGFDAFFADFARARQFEDVARARELDDVARAREAEAIG